jgi:hypothetical protein
MYLRAVWVRFARPPRFYLPLHFAPALFKFVRELNSQIGGPRVSRVVLTDGPNASMYSRPWLGLFGPVSHYLVLGVPLLAGMSTRHCRAIVAHEFAHMVGSGSWLNNLLQRSHERWSILVERPRSLQPRSFMQWYLPRLGATVAAMSQNLEQAADQAAVRIDEPRAVGDALIRTIIIDSYLARDYWPMVHERARELVTPPSDMVSRAVRNITDGMAEAHAETALARVLRDRTDIDDSHHCLADRLAQIGWPAPDTPLAADTELAELMPEQPAPVALDELLPPAILDRLLSEMDQHWVQLLAPQWVARHSQAQRAKRRLEKDSTQVPATAAELMRLAELRIEAHGVEPCIADLQRVLALEPEHARANFILGEHHVQADHAQGAEQLQIALEGDPQLVIPACGLLYEFYRGQGDLESAERHRVRADEQDRRFVKVGQEIALFGSHTRLKAHQLDEDMLEQLRETASYHPLIARMYVCRRTLTAMRGLRYYVIGVQVRQPWYGLRNERRDAKVCAQLLETISLDGLYTVYCLVPKTWLAKKVEAVAESLVYGAVP